MSLVQSSHVRGITDDERGASALLTAADTNGLATLENDLVDSRVEHICAAMDGAKTRKRFR